MTAAMDAARRGHRDFELRSRQFIDIVRRLLDTVPAGQLIGPPGLIDEFARRQQEAGAELLRLYEQPGDSDDLRDAGRSWTAVGAAIDGIAEPLAADRLRAGVEWEGRAARAYQALVPAQSANLAEVKALCDQLRTSLDNTANSLDTFWRTIVVAYAAYLVAIAAAVATALPVVTIKAAIGLALSAVSVLLGALSSALSAIQAHMTAGAAEHAAVLQKVRDLGTTWPRPAPGVLTDATTADGDPSDWRPGT